MDKIHKCANGAYIDLSAITVVHPLKDDVLECPGVFVSCRLHSNDIFLAVPSEDWGDLKPSRQRLYDDLLGAWKAYSNAKQSRK